MKGEVTHANGEHTATCNEWGCVWTFTTPIDGDAAHELMVHEHDFRKETREEVLARIKRQSMRDHPFEGDEMFCKHWSGGSNTTSEGTLTFKSQCGYPRDLHPEA